METFSGKIRQLLHYENAIYSRQVTDSRNLKIEKAILCCKCVSCEKVPDVLSVAVSEY